jgi:radical SAM superfamily enzyme YgiQ (UPF0313 family)
VLLVAANIHQAPYPVYPLGLDYVAGALGTAHPARIVDLAPCADPHAALERAMGDFKPLAVGLSLRNIDSTDAADRWCSVAFYRDLAATVRRAFDGPLILGGSGFTLFPAELMRTLGADYGIIGEGERLPALLAALERGQPVAGLPGVVRGGEAPPAPPPPWSGARVRRLDDGAPHAALYRAHGGMLNLQTQRGCTGRCIYCTYPLLEGGRLRPEPPAETAATARRLQEAGARYLYVADALFNADPLHSTAVAQALHDEGVRLPWGAFFAPLPAGQGFFRHLADCGLTHVEFGSESLCDRVLAEYRKPFRAADVETAHTAAREAGLHVAHYLILGGPGETAATVEETLSRVDKLDRTVIFFFPGMRIYPGTALHARALAEGQLQEAQNLLQPVYYRPPGIALECIAERLAEAARGRSNWIVGSGGARLAAVVARLHARGLSGPLWEHLVR